MPPDCLEPLAPHKAHSLYPAARMEVLKVRREHGPTEAFYRAQKIANAMTDETLERYMK